MTSGWDLIAEGEKSVSGRLQGLPYIAGTRCALHC